MSELLNHVEQSIRARRLFRPEQRILVAVSGGVDSMVLLDVLHQLAGKYQWQLTVAHLNHRLRGRSSDADERLVRRTAKRLKLPMVIEGADVRAFARAQGLSLEMAARRLRHDFLAGAAARRQIPSVALAHHADDQLELFFLRLLRGSGGEGLGGMKWRNPSPGDPAIELVRPLLDQPKAALLEYAGEQGIRHREDASNAVLDFQRNGIRHGLLPLLRRKYQPALDRTIARVMDIVGAEAGFVASVAEEWLRETRSPKSEVRSPKGTRREKSEETGASLRRLLCKREGGRGSVPFDQLPVAVQRRCVQLQLLRQGVVADYELVEQLRLTPDRPVSVSRAQAHDTATAGRVGEARPLCGPHRGKRKGDNQRTGETPAPLCAVRDDLGLVQVQAAEPAEFKAGGTAVELKGRAGEVEFGGARICWRIGLRRGVERPKAGVGREWFDADKVGALVWLRHWQPGDRFQPIGMGRPVKLQDFFTNQKVPRDRRRRLIVAAHGVTGRCFGWRGCGFRNGLS